MWCRTCQQIVSGSPSAQSPSGLVCVQCGQPGSGGKVPAEISQTSTIVDFPHQTVADPSNRGTPSANSYFESAAMEALVGRQASQGWSASQTSSDFVEDRIHREPLNEEENEGLSKDNMEEQLETQIDNVALTLLSLGDSTQSSRVQEREALLEDEQRLIKDHHLGGQEKRQFVEGSPIVDWALGLLGIVAMCSGLLLLAIYLVSAQGKYWSVGLISILTGQSSLLTLLAFRMREKNKKCCRSSSTKFDDIDRR
ncbi:MAG: hypothetical protein MPJ24_09965 [Pirellulaceae bacterium]|nr:hypothetical protein [Pirellulaceae bacterium]